MTKGHTDETRTNTISAQPRLHQRARELQRYGTVNHMLPLELEEPARLEMTDQLNQLLADTMTLRRNWPKLSERRHATRPQLKEVSLIETPRTARRHNACCYLLRAVLLTRRAFNVVVVFCCAAMLFATAE